MGYWRIKENRIQAVRELVMKTGKKPEDIGTKDFYYNRLAWIPVVTAGFRNALREAGFDPGDYNMKPKHYWKDIKNRIMETRALVKNLGKPVDKITSKDFQKNGLGGVIYHLKKHRIALQEAGFEVKDINIKPVRYWCDKHNRIKATRKMVNLLDKDPIEILEKDFNDANILLAAKRVGGYRNALIEAGYDIPPKKRRPNGCWNKKRNRVNAVKDLVKKLNKPVDLITKNDFKRNNLYSLIGYCSSIWSLFKEAGYVIDSKIIEARSTLNGKNIYTSNHGHKFKSIFECELDSYFYNKGIYEHKHNVRYPNSIKNCDFVIGRYWIEAAGLLGIKWYDSIIKEKICIAKEHNLKLIIISLDDFYKRKSFELKISDVLRDHAKIYNEKLTNFT